MTINLHQGLTGLTLTRGTAVTANASGLPCLYSDVATHRANAAPVKGFERFQQGEIALPEIAAAIEMDLSSQAFRLEMMFIESLTRWDRDQALNLAPDSGIVVTAPVTITSNQLGFLGLDNCKAVLQASTLAESLDQWQHALETHTEIERWYWLAVDSHCTTDWLMQQPVLFAGGTHPEGVLAGEALVITEWHRQSGEGLSLTFSGHTTEPNGENALHKPVAARQALLAAAEPNIAERNPVWAECLTNDSFSQANAAERYKTEVALWPHHEPQPELGPSEPFISWYGATGDTGLATLPLGLLLAQERLNHPLEEREWIGVLINDAANRHYWRLQR